MSASDGYVGGLAKVHDTGAPAARFNLVVVAEGYTAAQQAQFHADTQELVAHLFTQAPFSEDAVACAINVYRLDVVSNDSGADKPACGDGLGDGSTRATYFDATFCHDGAIFRLLGGNSTLVQDTVEAVLPEWTQIVVLVNDPERGGSGGSIAWASRGGFDWRDVILHEMGHSAFGLIDEYDCYTCVAGETGRDLYPSPEPLEPNVTIQPDPALVKWSALVNAGPDVPTMPNPDCTQRNLGPSLVPAGTVGTFEGAHFYHCGAFRPEYACRMRDSPAAFCAVCRQTIRAALAVYSVPAVTGDITLESLSLVFPDVPEGTAMVRSIVFHVDTCLPVTFEVLAPPAAPFSVAYEPVVVSQPGGAHVRVARLWIRFQCGAPGSSHVGSVTVRGVESGQVWTISLSGNCVTRPRTAVQLVLDRSASMLDITSEGRRKSDVLKDAARVFADVAYEDTGVGANAYDHDPHPLTPIAEAGPLIGGAGRAALREAIDAYQPNPNGLTAIGDGIVLARAELDAATGYDARAMIVLTDGIETAPAYVADVADAVVNDTVYAIGLGTAEQIRPTTLAALTNGTGGYLLMTGHLTPDDTFLLSKYYLQILAGVTNQDIILDPEGWLVDARVVRIPFDVAESDLEITGVALATATGAVQMALETPRGELIDAARAAVDPGIELARSPHSIVLRASLPVVIGGRPAHEGRWHLLLRREDRPVRVPPAVRRAESRAYQAAAAARRIKYSASVHTYSNLRMLVRLSQTSLEPGAELVLRVVLTEYVGPFRGSATVRAEITAPDGALATRVLAHEGEGVFRVAIPAAVPGIYRIRVIARGTTQRGQPFTREQWRTGAVWIGGDRPPERPPQDPGPGLGDLLCCLLRGGALSAELWRRLGAMGVDVARLRRCLGRLCPPSGRPPCAEVDPAAARELRELQAMISRALGEEPEGGGE